MATTHRRTILRFASMSACLLAATSLHAKESSPRGLRFDSVGVLDLAGRTLVIDGGMAVPVAALSAADARQVLGAMALDEDKPALNFSDDEYACAPSSRACSTASERKRIDAGDGKVRRLGNRLTISPSSGVPANFIDSSTPETKSADGDTSTHLYLGRAAGNGYHRVEVQFGHDAPGDFLVNPGNGKIAFVHNGGDVAVPSPDGLQLVTFNTMNPPLSVRVATLDANGPRLVLTCAVKPDSPATAQFKGWHDAHGFDLALLPGGSRGEELIALRLTQDAQGWHLATPDTARIAAIAFACRQSPP